MKYFEKTAISKDLIERVIYRAAFRIKRLEEIKAPQAIIDRETKRAGRIMKGHIVRLEKEVDLFQ